MKLTFSLRLAAVGVVAVRFAKGLWAAPSLERLAPSEPVTVIVPVRDEAERVGPLLAALRGESTVRVVVVDDGSSDDTVAVARAGGAAVVVGTPPPAGWNGKSWALRQGIEASENGGVAGGPIRIGPGAGEVSDPAAMADESARRGPALGDWVVAIDADVVVEPWLPAAAAERARRDGVDLLTLAGRFDLPDRRARWLHSSMLAGLVTRFGPPGTGGRLANGQCMVARRETMLAGLETVRSAPVEDVALARHVRSTGGTVEFLDADGAMVVRPYRSCSDVWRGWGRSIGLRSIEPAWRQMLELTVVAATMPLPLVRLATRRADVVDVAALTLRAGLLVGMRRAYLDRGVSYWCSPLADLPATVATWWGVFGPPRPWRGRRPAHSAAG